MLSTLLYFCTSCKHTRWTCSFFDCCFAINLCNKALYHFYLDRFIKTRLDLPQLKLECPNCQKSDIRTNSHCYSVLLWTSFCFLQINQQQRVGMVSANNMTNSEQIYKLFYQKPSHILFLIKKSRSADA